MRLLLDTQVFLWMNAHPGRLSPEALDLISDTGTEVLLSAASSWEIAIKSAIGKLRLPEPPETYVPNRIRATELTPVPIEHVHALRVAALPHHHRDPFDRLLVAQSQLLKAPLLTADRVFDLYDVETVAAG